MSLPSLLASSLLVTNSYASPITNIRKETLQKRQDAPFAVTGVQGSGVQPRLEIRDLQQNADQWNIYLLGLQRMQAVDQSDYLSWFQIAGKHAACMSPPNSASLMKFVQVSTVDQWQLGMEFRAMTTLPLQDIALMYQTCF